MKKIITGSLLIAVILLTVVGSVQAGNVRLGVLGDLDGIIEDRVVDMRQNPAQISDVQESELIFADTYLDIFSDSNQFNSDIFYLQRISETSVVGGNLFLDTLSNNYSRRIISPRGLVAHELEENLTLGGMLGLNIAREEIEDAWDEDYTDLVFQTGFNYQVEEDLTLDGSFGVNAGNDSYINFDGTEIQLYLRGIKAQDETYNLIMVGDFRFYDDENSQNIKVGHNFTGPKSMFAYAVELHNQDDLAFNLKWGVEWEIIDGLELRAGDSTEVLVIGDETQLKTPRIRPRLGLGYELDENSRLDVNLDHNYLELGSSNNLTLNFSYQLNL